MLFSMVVLLVFHDSERDGMGGGWVIQKWQFQRDVIIEQPLTTSVLYFQSMSSDKGKERGLDVNAHATT